METRCRDFLRDSLPALAEAPIVTRRICRYCDSLDGDLWIDRVPETDNLFVAAGGSGHAFKLAPMLGEIIADVVLGAQAWPRFAWREPGTGNEAARAVSPG